MQIKFVFDLTVVDIIWTKFAVIIHFFTLIQHFKKGEIFVGQIVVVIPEMGIIEIFGIKVMK